MPNQNIRKYIPADNNVICDVCGRKRKRSECVMAYGTGDIPVIMSCIDGCADSRHPCNDPPPIIFDGRPVMDARPEGSDTFVTQGVFFTGLLIGHFPGPLIGHFPNTASSPGSGFDLNPISSIGNLSFK